MTSKALREELLKLSVAERLELVEELWDSIPAESPAFDLTSEQSEDLRQRLAEADAAPDAGSSWEEVQDRIRDRHARRGS